MNDRDAALLALLRRLEQLDYDFVTVTPATHARVLARDERQAEDLRDVFGWSRPYSAAKLHADIHALLLRAGAAEESGGLFRSRVRVSRVDGRLFLHSAFPTDADDSVFLGPDTYRFVRWLKVELSGGGGVEAIVDMGAGSGAGGIIAAAMVPGAALSLIDCNPQALRLAAINAAAAGVEARLIEAESLNAIDEPVDLIVANPPYMIDAARRAYRDGGKLHGGERALQWAEEGAARLRPGGRMLLYTGSAIVDGRSVLAEALQAAQLGWAVTIEEIDPDVFGEELETPAYANVERIAALGILIRKEGEMGNAPGFEPRIR